MSHFKVKGSKKSMKNLREHKAIKRDKKANWQAKEAGDKENVCSYLYICIYVCVYIYIYIYICHKRSNKSQNT